MYCRTCGAQISDRAEICAYCGCPTDLYDAPRTVSRKKRGSSGVVIVAVVLIVVLVLVAALAALIFTRSNLKMEDLTVKPSLLHTLITFGITDDVNEERWLYDDCIEFYGVEIDHFMVYPEKDKYVIFEFDEQDQEALANALARYCDYEKNALELYYYFTYENLDITASNDCSQITIEVND